VHNSSLMAHAQKIIGITIGDPAGIGPEVACRAAAACRSSSLIPVLIGPRPLWQQAAGRRRLCCGVVDIPLPQKKSFSMGRPSAAAGRIVVAALDTGIRLARTGYIDALVTAPVSKQSLHAAGCGFTGHTELLARACGVRAVAMLMACARLTVCLATRHIPLARVPRVLTRQLLTEQILISEHYMRRALKKRPRIMVAGLNPHAGDGGLAGAEEARVIAPVVRALRSRGMRIAGPLSADTVFPAARAGQYDLVIALYHDQAMIALKMMAPEPVVNITAGLPFVRTSPGHGTAFDIAGKHRADPAAMIAAVKRAARYA